MTVRPSRAVTGARASSRRATSSSSGPGAASARASAASASDARRRAPASPAVASAGAFGGAAGSVGPPAASVPARIRANSSSTEGVTADVPRVVLSRPPSGSHVAQRRRRRLPRRLVHRVLVVGALLGAAQPELVADGHRGGPRLVVGALQVRQDPVHLVAHAEHGRGHFVAGGTQLLNLDPERATPRRQVGQHTAPGLLHLLEECPPLVLGAGDDRLPVGHGLGEEALALHAGLLLGVRHQQLDLDDALGRRGLGARLQLVDLALGLAQQGGRTLLGLGDDSCRLLVGVAQDLRAVLPQRRREGGLVDDGVGGPLLGLGHGGAQLLLALLECLDAPRHRLQVGPHLVRVEAPPHDGERVAGDVPGRDAGR